MPANAFPFAVVITAVDRASGAIGAISSRVNKFADRTQEIGRDLTFGLTAPIVTLGALATVQAFQSERALLRLEDASGATAEQLRAASEAGRDLLGDFNPADPIDALTAMVRQGVSLEEALRALPAAANLATASEVGLADAARITLQVARAYKRDLADVVDVTDMLALTSAATEGGLESIAGQLVELSPLAGEAALELEDVVAAVRVLGRAGQNPTTTLRAALVALINPSKRAAEELARLKISPEDLFDAEGRLRSLAHLIGVLEQRGADGAAMLRLFGNRAGPGMAALLRSGELGLTRAREEIEKTGAAAEMAGRRHRSAQGGVVELENAIEDFGVSLSESGLTSAIAEVAREAAGMVRDIAGVDPAVTKGVLRMAAAAAALGPVIWTFSRLSAAISAASAAWSTLAGLAAPVATAFGVGASTAAAVPLAAGAGILFEDEINAFMDKQPWAQRLSNMAANLIDSGAGQAAEWFLTGGGLVDWITPQAPGLGTGRAALELERAARSAPAAPASADVLVRFEGAPPGTRATVQRSSGVDVGLDVGYAMTRD